jgi:DNA-binding response OmpR family regulator
VTPTQTILVIDDNVNIAQGFAMALEGAGYRVHTAHAADHGLRLAQSEHPSAIVLDLRMPFINGAGFLYRLRSSPGLDQTPVMVVTGAEVNDEMRTELADLRAVVRFKPLGLMQLIAEVDGLLKNTQLPPATVLRSAIA